VTSSVGSMVPGSPVAGLTNDEVMALLESIERSSESCQLLHNRLAWGLW
jgi:hypothetical protein